MFEMFSLKIRQYANYIILFIVASLAVSCMVLYFQNQQLKDDLKIAKQDHKIEVLQGNNKTLGEVIATKDKEAEVAAQVEQKREESVHRTEVRHAKVEKAKTAALNVIGRQAPSSKPPVVLSEASIDALIAFEREITPVVEEMSNQTQENHDA